MRFSLLAAVVLLGLAAGTANAAKARFTVSPATASAGAPVLVRGNAAPCTTGATVFAISRAFPGKQFGAEGALTGKVHANGSFSFRGHVRAHLKPGRYAVTGRCGGGNLGVTAYLRVKR
jgi:hypothetical protein